MLLFLNLSVFEDVMYEWCISFFLSLTPYLHPCFFPLLQFKTCSLLLLHTETHTYIDTHTHKTYWVNAPREN